ncbi:Flavin-dependent monooxygenase 1 [Tripterygium wilfordii]|uniref:Flavin-containing monooxygenase n=1 Tax=Tripterygium wilfordii TaxID=458696 RepID=A0A7J7DQ09_TRIWF|nr:Flavin-dependent monooxygenase 1 [Tripterygium wilfordii]
MPTTHQINHQLPLVVSRIAIIGGGVSGLAALKQLSHYNPILFEATDSIGGVWGSCSYSSTKLQSPRSDYEFTDFPWPNRDDPSFPSHLEILNYLDSYVKHFDLRKYIKFSSKVVELRFIGDRSGTGPGEYGSLLPGQSVWEVAVQHNESETIQRQAVSKFIESYLLWKLPLIKYGLKPEHPFVEDYASCQMAIMPENFFDEADKGKIVFKRASKWWFSREGIEFEDYTKIAADVVIFATGYDGKKKLKTILPEPFQSLLESTSGVMPLYRGTIHPLIPNMAFVGYIESVSNLHTAELRSMWLARLVGEKFKLPSVEKMLEQVSKEIEVMKKSTRFYKRHCISTFSINHSDEICEEMGWNSWRKKSWLAEAFSAYGSQDYEEHEIM